MRMQRCVMIAYLTGVFDILIGVNNMSLFDPLEMQAEDPIFGILSHYRADQRLKKINLSVGVYQNENGVTPVLNTVRKAEAFLATQKSGKEYLPISGDPSYCRAVELLIFGGDHTALEQKRVTTVQTIGGSGALRIGAEFLHRIGVERLALPEPSWANHRPLMVNGGLSVSTYSYYNPSDKNLDFAGMLKSIEKLPKNSAILLHACCHNPTGVDPSPAQWQILSAVIKKCGLIPFFDCAYIGFKTGLEEDAYPVRLFSQEGHCCLIACSFAKNMGLYGERAGALCFVGASASSAAIVQSYLKILIRSSYSNPPIHSAAIVRTILNDPDLSKEWCEEVATMRARICAIRHSLIEKLGSHFCNGEYEFLKNQYGMFSYIGLTGEQIGKLRDNHAIYMTGNGRINVAGLNTANLDTFIEAFLSVRESS